MGTPYIALWDGYCSLFKSFDAASLLADPTNGTNELHQSLYVLFDFFSEALRRTTALL